VNLASLPIISIDGRPPASPRPVTSAAATAAPAAGSTSAQEADIFSAIELLADLRAKGILSDEEFTQKKAALLSRL